jgi:hypothetical protein
MSAETYYIIGSLLISGAIAIGASVFLGMAILGAFSLLLATVKCSP